MSSGLGSVDRNVRLGRGALRGRGGDLPGSTGQPQGVVEKVNLSAAQRWWRTLADEVSPAQAQASLDRFWVRVGDALPRRRGDGTRVTVADLAAGEGLRRAPTGPYPAILTGEAKVSPQGLMAFRGNRYSVGPLPRRRDADDHPPVGTATLDLVTARGVVLARHRRGLDSAGAVIRHDDHVAALERGAVGVHRPRAVSAQTTPTTLAGGPR